jgi:hypothetical protein
MFIKLCPEDEESILEKKQYRLMFFIASISAPLNIIPPGLHTYIQPGK